MRLHEQTYPLLAGLQLRTVAQLPASVGLTLSFDDNLEVAANASVKVYCSNEYGGTSIG